MVVLAERMKNKEYVFASLMKRKNELAAMGHVMLDFGVGDCTEPAPQQVVEALRESVLDGSTHHYSSYNGTPEFRKSIKSWFEKRFSITLDFNKEITALIGSKEAIFRAAQTIINPGDIALVPDPAYPVYASSVLHAGGTVYYMPLLEKNLFLPDLSAIPEDIKKKAKLIYINYPNNPTTATADEKFLKSLYEEAVKYDWAIFGDMAYCEIYDKQKPLSILSFDTNKERSIEFYSFSKSYNMTGWRIGFAAGAKELVSALVAVKSEQGSAPFEPVQKAAIRALTLPDADVERIRDYYRAQRTKMYAILENAGIDFFKSDAGFYVWAKVPSGFSSIDWCKKLMEEKHIVTTPGSSLGIYGEGWFRMTLTRTDSEMEEFSKRMSSL